MDILNEEFLLFLKCAAQNNLRYLLIGGYAVNYYGYNRNTNDLDVWIAPTGENKTCFLNTLLCMKYSESEVAPLQNEDFTLPFVGHFGTPGNDIDVLTVVHHSISYEEAEKNKNVFEIEPDLFMNIVPYDFLLRMKLLARRPKDYLDISELNKLRNNTHNKMDYSTLLATLENGIFTITINRPDKLNALNKTVIEELSAAIDEVYNNPEIKSAIITGAGPKAFVAGADITEFLTLDAAGGKELAQKGQDMVFTKIENTPKPIVAAVNGFALGGGCELAMACHFRLCSENAKFGQPEVNLGLIPGYGGTQRLTQLIGKGRAMEMLISANMIDANTALQYGLVNYVVPPEELLNKTKSILELINTKAPLAVAACIKAANAVFDETKNGYQTEIDAFGDCFATEDMKEGTTAFLEKRKAEFKGK